MLARNLLLIALMAVLAGGATAFLSGGVRGIGNHAGFAPVQPIAFSHRLHAGELQIQCLYCHDGAEKSRHAGIPEASVCMNCHRAVTAPRDLVLQEEAQAKSDGREPRPILSPEIAKLYRALGWNGQLERDPSLEPAPIEWTRVHHLPDFVYFDHRPHVLRGVACESCHGPVQSMERVRQELDLSMGWCIDCHRRSKVEPGAAPESAAVSTDCATCHF